jgi:hypothetical protein
MEENIFVGLWKRGTAYLRSRLPALRQEREGRGTPVLLMPARSKAWATRPASNPGDARRNNRSCVDDWGAFGLKKHKVLR